MNSIHGKPEILVIDDEKPTRHLLRFTFQEAGYVVREAADGRSGLVEAAHHQPAAITLDLVLPDMPGMQVLQTLREWTNVPILILSACDRHEWMIGALDAGADDFVTKPFDGDELLARLRVLLRRAAPVTNAVPVRFGDVEIDFAFRHVRKAGQLVKLTAREYALLHLLAVNRGKVLTHTQILRELWGPNSEHQTHYLRVFMMRLRHKLEDKPEAPVHLLTESSVGYRLAAA